MKAVVADEWAVLRGGVAAVLAAEGVTVVRQSSSATAALGDLHPGGPELFVVGLVSDQNLEGAVRRAKAIAPDVRVVVLMPDPERRLLAGLLDAGADAVLTRTATEDELCDAVVRVSRAERFVAPGLLAMLFGDGRPSVSTPSGDGHPLTERERRVLALLVEGRSNREIAAELFIGEATVKTHLHNVYAKLDVSNRVQAVSRAIEMRLLY